MAYKVSYKVVSEQGDQLKNIAKEMDDYVSRLNQIVSKLGNDELLQSVRGDLNKFKQQLEEEKTVLNLAGQILGEVVQNYTGVEKKSVSKVDKAKAHNRDFYKRPVAVASAGGASAGTVQSAAGYSSSVNINTTTNTQSVTNTTNVFNAASPDAAGMATAAASAVGTAASGMSGKEAAMVGSIAAAVGSVAAAGGAVAGAELAEKRREANTKNEC